MESLSLFLSTNIENVDQNEKEKIYMALISTTVEHIPKISLRKILKIALSCLKFKGAQALDLQHALERSKIKTGSESADIVKIDRLEKKVLKLETERTSLKIKLEEMNTEITELQSRLLQFSANESDKISNDPLSELEKHEDLLKKISIKNKHIKRLIKDIGSLQKENIEQSQTIIDLEKKFQAIASEKLYIQEQIFCYENENAQLKDHIKELKIEISRSEDKITYLEQEREKADINLKEFIQKLEHRACLWKKLIADKEKQFDAVKEKYESLRNENPKIKYEKNLGKEVEHFIEAIEERDKIIEKQEVKVKLMATEIIASTNLMNHISLERETEHLEDKVKRSCCKTTQNALTLLQERYKELSEVMEKLEEENILKSKQANAAINKLDTFQNSNDVLGKSLQKIIILERKLESRDKQIKALIMEINSLHETTQENSILRQQLNISESDIVTTNNFVAKQRNRNKMMDRLMLKFRSSEEMRLQLKLEKMDMTKEIIDLRKKIANSKYFNFEPVEDKITKPDEINETVSRAYCENCLKNVQSFSDEKHQIQNVVKEWEQKYSEVIEENENLRIGMHEILEKIRNYDALSDHLTIDCKILEKLLHALDARSISGWYHPAMRLQNELVAVKEREHALKEKLHLLQNFRKEKKEVSMNNTTRVENVQLLSDEKIDNELKKDSIEQYMLNETKHISNDEDASISIESITNNQNKNDIDIIDVQSKELNNVSIENGVQQESNNTEFKNLEQKYRSLQIETETLKTYKIQFHELVEELKNSKCSILQYCSLLSERFNDLDLKLIKQNKMYEFLKEDFDINLSFFNSCENRNISTIADLKKQLNNKNHEINLLKLMGKKIANTPSEEEYFSLKINFEKIKNQLSQLISELFQNKDHPEFILDSGINLGIITDDMQLDFITIIEFKDLTENIKSLQNENDCLKVEIEKLKDLLVVSEEQVSSQQNLLSEITNTHIHLRHLTSDLESSSEHNFVLAKALNDLDLARKECLKLKSEKMDLAKENEKQILNAIQKQADINQMEIDKMFNTTDLKIKFLKHYIFSLHQKYKKYTPLIFLSDFASLLANFRTKLKEQCNIEENFLSKINEIVTEKLQNEENRGLIELVQYEVKCKFLEGQLNLYKKRLENVENQLHAAQMSALENHELCKTIQALFGNTNEENEVKHIGVQTIKIELKDLAINTEQKTKQADLENATLTSSTQGVKKDLENSETVLVQYSHEDIKLLENQLQQAKILASKRNVLVLETENLLFKANGKIKEYEKIIDEQKEYIAREKYVSLKKKSGIMEATVASLQSVLLEKDLTLSHYQELLKTERDQHIKSCHNFEKDIISLKQTQSEIQETAGKKDQEILYLKNQLEQIEKNKSFSKVEIISPTYDEESPLNSDNGSNKISDENDKMLMDENKILTAPTVAHIFFNMKTVEECSNEQIDQLMQQISDLKNREIFLKCSLNAKDNELTLLKDKLITLQESEKNKLIENAEIEQMRVILDERDKHINDLMETLTNFHDDQQKFLSETSLYSSNQITHLGTNLNRCEATNKVLQTQLDALKRQLNTLSQREKQSRDFANSLRNRSIERPLVSIKSEINSKTRIEQQRKLIHNLQEQLEAAKKEVQQLQKIVDKKRLKNRSEINMWEKQKTLQQNIKRLKVKLEETNKNLERTRSLLSASRATINRLEKNQNAHQDINKIQSTTPTTRRCCQNSACPNFRLAKFGPKFASKEDLTNNCLECSTARMCEHNTSSEHMDMLKSNTQFQHRQICALEISRNEPNSMISEIEKLQERVSVLDSQNIRSEAKNLQLQLELDLVKQGNENDHNKKRIKYLENYILALKEELAQAEISKRNSGQTDMKEKSTINDFQQTISAFKRIIGRLKIENKRLKRSRTSFYNSKTDKALEFSNLKHLYTEAMNKISALNTEIQLKRNICNHNIHFELEHGDLMHELKFIKQKLIKKTQLLEKAKILLNRAVAKEKNLKEQLFLWKRKCSELKNVPVIEEISE